MPTRARTELCRRQLRMLTMLFVTLEKALMRLKRQMTRRLCRLAVQGKGRGTCLNGPLGCHVVTRSLPAGLMSLAVLTLASLQGWPQTRLCGRGQQREGPFQTVQ